MVDELGRLTAAVRDVEPELQRDARSRLAEWLQAVLVPHADEEERTIYHAAAQLPQGALLIDAMVREHVLIKRLVTLFEESDGAACAAYGRAIFETFESHQRKENEMILPLLSDAPRGPEDESAGSEHAHAVGAPGHAHP